MLEGKTFLGATGMPIEKMARVSTRLADWLPEPLTVAARRVRSLTIWSTGIRVGAEGDGCPPCGGSVYPPAGQTVMPASLSRSVVRGEVLAEGGQGGAVAAGVGGPDGEAVGVVHRGRGGPAEAV